MNIQDYISSGIIESYVLGMASVEERAEFDQVCRQHPEVLKAREAFERLLEKQAMENTVRPDADLKKKIFDQIGIPEQRDFSEPAILRKISPAKTIWMRWAVAACLVLLAGSVYWNYSLYNKNRKLHADMNSSVARLNDIEKEIDIIRENPNIKMASMKGMDISPQSHATVYWDTTSHDVYLLVNNLPEPANDRQYQIWALLDGKPIDIGMVDNEYFIKQNRLLVKAKNVQNAQAFAITLEKKGGSSTPTMDKMYVMGNL